MIKPQELVMGTVVITVDNKIAVIMEHRTANIKYPYIYRTSVKGASYKGCIENFVAVVGEVDIVDFKKACENTLMPKNKWEIPDELQNFNIGDEIIIEGNNKGRQKVIFRGYNPKRPKNCVTIEFNGKEYKGPLSIVKGKADEVDE
jgi:hypothetical protein